MLRTNGFICDNTKQRMKDTLMTLSKQMPEGVSLDIPETLRGGSLFDLFKQYEQEMHREVVYVNNSPFEEDVERMRMARSVWCMVCRLCVMYR